MESNVAGIETADYEIVEVGHDAEALTELFAGASVVCNTVGPFSKHGPAVVEAALASGVHYLDTTGEQDWLITCDEQYGADFAAAGLLLAPGVAQMYTTGEIAAEVALERPGLDTLDIAVFWGGSPTVASTLTILVNAALAGAFYLEQNAYAALGPGRRPLPAGHPGPARARARPAVGRHLAPGLVPPRPPGRQRQGSRRRLQQGADDGRAADRGGRGRGDQGHGAGREVRRPHRHRVPGDEPDAARARTRGSTSRSTRCTPPVRSAGRTWSSTATRTTSRPARCRPTRRTPCCSSRRSGSGSPRAARPSAIASCSGVLRSFGLVVRAGGHGRELRQTCGCRTTSTRARPSDRTRPA